MPLPTPEEVREAVETAVREGITCDFGSWVVPLPNGDEVEFSPSDNGEIFIELDSDDDTKLYRLRVCVEIIPEETVRCVRVWLDRGTPNENWYLVQHYVSDEETQSAESCLAYLRDCGHSVETEDYPTQGPSGEPCVSWGDLSDIVEPRDE